MAECIFKKLVNEQGIQKDFVIDSAATTTEEEGCLIYAPAKEELNKHGVKTSFHHARRVTEADMNFYDYVICMEQRNVSELFLVVPRDHKDKVSLLLDYTDNPREIADPYYTRDFAKAYEDINEGCTALLNKLK